MHHMGIREMDTMEQIEFVFINEVVVNERLGLSLCRTCLYGVLSLGL